MHICRYIIHVFRQLLFSSHIHKLYNYHGFFWILKTLIQQLTTRKWNTSSSNTWNTSSANFNIPKPNHRLHSYQTLDLPPPKTAGFRWSMQRLSVSGVQKKTAFPTQTTRSSTFFCKEPPTQAWFKTRPSDLSKVFTGMNKEKFGQKPAIFRQPLGLLPCPLWIGIITSWIVWKSCWCKVLMLGIS